MCYYIPVRILGIDPGIGRCGWAILEYKNSGFKVGGYGCIETPPKSDKQERLMTIYREITDIIKKQKPETLSIEELFFNTNSKTAFSVGEARGVIMLAAGANKLPIFAYTPLQVKMALTGYGRAEKSQVGKMVKTMLFLPEVPKPDDTADALAVAITHAFSFKTLKIKK